MTAELYHKSHLCPVGHGLLFHGRIQLPLTRKDIMNNHGPNKIDYIFDCGGDKIQSVIDTHLLQSSKFSLNILVVSHLHKDHVNGLPQLLKNSNPKYIVLPYLFPIERLVVYAEQAYREGPEIDEEWYSKFIADPVSGIRTLNEKVEIVFIRGGGEEDRLENQPPFDNPDDNPIKIKLEAVVNKNAKDHANTLDFGMSKTDILNDTSSVIAIETAPLWRFTFFNRSLGSEQIGVLSEKLQIPSDIDKLADVLKDQQKLSSIKKVYSEVFADMNASSLAMFSECRLSGNYNHVSEEPHSSQGYLCANRTGYLLTGDLHVNQVWAEFYDKFMNGSATVNPSNILEYQLPHHGSIRNWDKKQLNIPFWPRYLVSSRYNDKKHPNPIVIRDLILNNKCMGVATELGGYRSKTTFYS